jgi:hypothetical protein
MDVQTMLRTAVILLGLTAVGGIASAAFRFSGKPHPPSWLAMLHGLAAASGLTLLYAGVAGHVRIEVWLGLALLVVAAIGGITLNLVYHWHHRELAIWLVLVHGAVAAVGFADLVYAVWFA